MKLIKYHMLAPVILVPEVNEWQRDYTLIMIEYLQLSILNTSIVKGDMISWEKKSVKY